MRFFVWVLWIVAASSEAGQSALEAFKHHDYTTAFRGYAQHAKEGNVTAQNALSYLYFQDRLYLYTLFRKFYLSHTN